MVDDREESDARRLDAYMTGAMRIGSLHKKLMSLTSLTPCVNPWTMQGRNVTINKRNMHHDIEDAVPVVYPDHRTRKRDQLLGQV